MPRSLSLDRSAKGGGDGSGGGGCGGGSASDSAVRGVTRVTEALEKPSLDDRTYRVIRLPNDLEALLVNDAETDKASAALDVGVGSFCDEEDMAGMAHAVEHVCPALPSCLATSYICTWLSCEPVPVRCVVLR